MTPLDNPLSKNIISGLRGVYKNIGNINLKGKKSGSTAPISLPQTQSPPLSPTPLSLPPPNSGNYSYKYHHESHQKSHTKHRKFGFGL